MQPDVSSWCAIQDLWEPVQPDSKRSIRLNNRFDFVPNSISTTDTRTTIDPSDQQFDGLAPQAQCSDIQARTSDRQADPTMLSFAFPSTYLPQPSMSPSNAPANPRDATTLPPPDTPRDESNVPPTRRSLRRPRHTATTSTPTTRPRRKTSQRTDPPPPSPTPSPPPPRRHRPSSPSPIPSARATYLLKNRQAASKCRNKQKLQQEELVETARAGERRNKVLRREVERLERDVRALLGVAGVHAGCVDQRLRVYVERRGGLGVGMGMG